VAWSREAISAGVRKRLACAEAGLSLRTFQRWTQEAGQIREDQRAQAQRPEPANKLSEQEREQVLAICNQPAYADLPPSQIVPRLADRGLYLASESSFYRILKAADQLHHRGRVKAPQKRRPPTTHQAKAANEVWTWDISYRAPSPWRCYG
jgi:putative transposase